MQKKASFIVNINFHSVVSRLYKLSHLKFSISSFNFSSEENNLYVLWPRRDGSQRSGGDSASDEESGGKSRQLATFDLGLTLSLN